MRLHRHSWSPWQAKTMCHEGFVIREWRSRHCTRCPARQEQDMRDGVPIPRPARRPEVGRWYVRARWYGDFLRNDPLRRTLDIAVMKPKREFPELAEPRHGADYRGIRFRLYVWVPFVVERWR